MEEGGEGGEAKGRRRKNEVHKSAKGRNGGELSHSGVLGGGRQGRREGREKREE